MDKLNVLSLFSGIGAFEKALENLNIPYNLVNYCEIDKYASKSYSVIHDISEEKNLWDVTKVDTKAFQTPIDFVTYGFPCVPRGFKVKTDSGYKNVEDVICGDKVLTHTNTYRKVVKTMNRISDHINVIKGVGCCDLQITDEHPVYTYKDGEFVWVKAIELTTKSNLVYNINQESIPCDCSDNELWLLGRFCADGYRENHSLHRPIFCIGKKKKQVFEEHLVDIEYSVAHEERNCIEYKIKDNHIAELLECFGTGSTSKQIPQWVINLPVDQLKIFLDGYLSGDGHERKDRKLTMFCTTSEKMFLSLQDIIIKIHHVVPTVSVRVDNRKESFNNTYNAQFSTKPIGQQIIEDKIVVPIKSIYRIEKEIEVFNFEVEKDNSYTISNVIVHNCQDISCSGNQKGFTDENGNRTRSGLFFEALRIIEDCHPKFAIAENVKALTSKKFAKEFDIVLTSLEKAGYNNYYQILNAKDYGIPQNRERVFVVSIRKDIDKGFIFPEAVPLQIRLKDILDKEVDESYYLSDSISQDLIKSIRQNEDE